MPVHRTLAPSLLSCACAAGGNGVQLSSTSLATSADGSSGASEASGSSTAADRSGSGGTSSAATGATGADADSGSGESSTGGAGECGALLETFAMDPQWSSTAMPDGLNDFGWRASANAGGDPGELGGTFQRSSAYDLYADTTIAQAGPADCVTASGRMIVTLEDTSFDSNVTIGHFRSSDVGSMIGLTFSEGDGDVRIYMVAGGLSVLAFQPLVPFGPVAWSYAYDPAGTGTMTLEIEGMGSMGMPLVADQQAGIDGIDTFGLAKPGLPNPGDFPGVLELYLDEIEYTR